MIRLEIISIDPGAVWAGGDAGGVLQQNGASFFTVEVVNNLVDVGESTGHVVIDSTAAMGIINAPGRDEEWVFVCCELIRLHTAGSIDESIPSDAVSNSVGVSGSNWRSVATERDPAVTHDLESTLLPIVVKCDSVLLLAIVDWYSSFSFSCSARRALSSALSISTSRLSSRKRT